MILVSILFNRIFNELVNDKSVLSVSISWYLGEWNNLLLIIKGLNADKFIDICVHIIPTIWRLNEFVKFRWSHI